MGPLKLLPLGYERLTASLLTSASKLSPPAGARVALITPTAAPVSFRDDGHDPTATRGMIIANSIEAPFEYWGDLSKISFITAGSGAGLNVSYYGISG